MKFFDHENDRKLHVGKIPNLGGIAIFTSFALTLVGLELYGFELSGGLDDHLTNPVVALLFLVGFVVFLTGVFDDLTAIRARHKLIVQLIAATLITVIGGIKFQAIYIPVIDIEVTNYFVTTAISFVWLVGACNAINLIDGLDGLSSAVSMTALAGLWAISFFMGNNTVGLLSLALLGAVFGFFIYNWPPAKIFMGDCGSLFIGFFFGLVPMLSVYNDNRLYFSQVITLLIIPITDTFLAIIRRLAERKKISEPDRNHIHHILLDLGFSNKQVLLFVLIFSLVTIGSVLFCLTVSEKTGSYLMIAIWTLVFGLFLLLYRALKARKFNLKQASVNSDK